MQVAGGGAPRSGGLPTPVSPNAHKELLQWAGLAFFTFKILYFWDGGGMPFFCVCLLLLFSLSLLNTYFLASNIESVTSRSLTRQVPRCPSFSREQQGRGGEGVRAGDPHF